MRVLVIAPQPFFSPRGTPFSVYYRTLVMAEMGLEIDLLTYGEGQDVIIPGVRIIRIPRIRFLGDIKIGPSLPKLMLDALLVLWTISLLVRRRYDFLHAHEEAVFFCLPLKWVFGFKLLYDMHSSLSQQLSNFGFTRSRLLIGAFRLLEDASLRASNAVITICPDLAEYVNRRIPDRRKHLLIENSIFEPVKTVDCLRGPARGSRSSFLQHAPPVIPPNRRLVVYAGTLEPYQGINLLIEAFGHVTREHSDAFLLVVGGSPAQTDNCRLLAEKTGLAGSAAFIGQVPQQEAQNFSRMADVLVSPRIKGTNTPLKIYQQLASGVPLVATRIYSHTQVLDDDVAFLVDPTSKGIAEGIAAALRNGSVSALKAANAKSLYQRRYARFIYEAKMRQILSILTCSTEEVHRQEQGGRP